LGLRWLVMMLAVPLVLEAGGAFDVEELVPFVLLLTGITKTCTCGKEKSQTLGLMFFGPAEVCSVRNLRIQWMMALRAKQARARDSVA